MSNFPVSGAPSGAEGKVPGFVDAVQRAKEVMKNYILSRLYFIFSFSEFYTQIASKIRPGSGPPPSLHSPPSVGHKRPSDDLFGGKLIFFLSLTNAVF